MVCACYPVCKWCLMVCFPFQIICPVWHLSKKIHIIVYSDSSFSCWAANLKPHVNMGMESLYLKWLAFTKNQFHLLLHCLLNLYCEVLLCLFKTDFLLTSEIITVSKFCYIIKQTLLEIISEDSDQLQWLPPYPVVTDLLWLTFMPIFLTILFPWLSITDPLSSFTKMFWGIISRTLRKSKLIC